MKHSKRTTDFDVIQIGYGPVSKVFALLLDRLGWSVGVFERWGEIYPLPRAVCIDHEINRALHAYGLGHVVDGITQPSPVYRLFNADWQELLALDWTVGSVSGGAENYFLHQPTFEGGLDLEAKKRPNISLNFEHECVGVTQHEDHVEIRVRDTATGEEKSVTARYLIGIDGANSFVRETMGTTRTDLGFEADWLVVDFRLNPGLDADALGIPVFAQYCNPDRPTTLVPAGIENGRILRRWEFMLLPGESKEEFEQTDKVLELLGDWVSPDQGELVRHAIYTFRSLVADKWRDGRILLAGDAAHLMPPFMGQGMCAGLRDVVNLAWKLDAVLGGDADDSLLDSYELERKPHVTDVIKMSMFLGEMICIPDKTAAAERDAVFLSGKAPPPKPFPHLTDGLLARGPNGEAEGTAGLLGPHGFVRYKRRTDRFDNFISPGFVLMLQPGLSADGLSTASHEILFDLDVRVVSLATKTTARDDEIADTQGQFLRFMSDRGMSAMLIRPDFFLFGSANTTGELDDLISDLGEQTQALGMR